MNDTFKYAGSIYEPEPNWETISRAPYGALRKTEGGFYRIYVAPGFGLGPYATREAAVSAIKAQLAL